MAEEGPTADAAASSSARIPAATESQGTATSSVPGNSNTTSSIGAPAGLSASSSTSLDTIDDICNAIFNITVSASDPNAQYKLASQSLLPALQHLDNRGTALGVPGAVVLSSPLQGNQDPLQVLLTQIPSTGLGLGYLYILVARCHVENADAQYLLPFIIQYIQAADSYQLRLVPHKVTALANALARFTQNQEGDAVVPLLTLNSKLQGDYRQYLTALHPLILYAALKSGQLVSVLPLLREHPVLDVDTRTYPVVYQDNLKYHLYGGIILAAVSDYQGAARMLETAVTAPCHTGTSSALQIDAYKQLVLVQLLLDGKTTPLPKYTSPNLISTFKSLCTTPYLDFARAYDALNTNKIVDLVIQHRKTFEQDGTFGLVSRCVHMIPARNIIKLANVYKTIEIQDVIQQIGIVRPDAETPGEAVGQVLVKDIEEAKDYVRQVVDALAREKKLAAHVKLGEGSEQTEYLEFVSEKMSPEESAAALQTSLNLLRHSAWTVSNLDKTISSSRDFVSKAYAISARGSGISDGMMDPGFDTAPFHPGGFAVEEDLMGDTEHGNDIWA